MDCDAQLAYSRQLLDAFLGIFTGKVNQADLIFPCDLGSLIGLSFLRIFTGKVNQADLILACDLGSLLGLCV